MSEIAEWLNLSADDVLARKYFKTILGSELELWVGVGDTAGNT